MRLIDADALVPTTLTDGAYWTKEVYYKSDIDAAPTIYPTPNDPLTLEELLEMEGEPVWIEPIGNRYQKAEWGIVHLCPPPNIAEPQVVRVLTGIISFEQSLMHSKKKRNQRYGKSWIAYRRKPEEGTP